MNEKVVPRCPQYQNIPVLRNQVASGAGCGQSLQTNAGQPLFSGLPLQTAFLARDSAASRIGPHAHASAN
jgi:hypothetical protein